MRQVLSAISAFACMSSCCSANLLLNGSFEQGADPNPFFTVLPPGSASITNWSVVSASIDYVGNGWLASSGVRSVDLDGDPGNAGGVQQEFSTTIGEIYVVSFMMAGNPQGGPIIKTMQASVGNVVVPFSFDSTGATYQNMGWAMRTFQFEATSSTSILTLQSLVGTGYGPVVDDVSVVLLPSPGAGAVLILGAATRIGRRRRT